MLFLRDEININLLLPDRPTLQEAFDDYSKVRENFGPSFKHKTYPDESVNLNWPIGGHQDHIHVSVQSY